MKRALNIFSNLLLLLAAAAALLLFAPRAAGMGTYAVLSSSMEPALPTGSVIYTSPVAGLEDISEQDIITYQAASIFVAHRAITVDRDAGTLITKGDANKVADSSPVYIGDVTGKVRYYIPYLGYALIFLEGKSGRLAICLTAMFILALMLFPSGNKKVTQQNQQPPINLKEESSDYGNNKEEKFQNQ